MSVIEFIETLVRNCDTNRLDGIDGTPIFDEPIVGLADGDDYLFTEYKRIIGDFHFTPREILKKHSPEWNEKNDSCSVICWVLPIAEETRKSNAIQSRYPSERWAHTKLYGEIFNEQLRRAVVEYLLNQGNLAVAPVLSPFFKTRYTGKAGIASSWSERHVLFAAGACMHVNEREKVKF
jgi:hypothetical protein